MKKISLLLLILCFMLSGCNKSENKEVKSLSDFRNICISHNFTINNNVDDYKNIDYVSEAVIASLDDIEMQMVLYVDSDSAEKVINSHIKSFMTLKGSGSVISKDKGNNYYHFDMISNGYYMVSSRIDNTLVFTKTPVKNKEMVDTILNELGY